MTTIILGAGLAGVTTAWYLAAEGRKVKVIDRQPVAAYETSYANAGMIASGHAYTWASPRTPGLLWLSRRDRYPAIVLRPQLIPQLRAWRGHYPMKCIVDNG